MLSIAAAWVPSSSLRPRQASTALKMEDKPYGEWPSPVTAKFITTSGVRLGPLAVDLRGELYWNEGRPQEGGRNVVVRRRGRSATQHDAPARRAAVRDESDGEDDDEEGEDA